MTDERDKRYGVLGLYTFNTRAKLDYILRAREVYVNTFQVILEESKNLDGVYYAGLEAICVTI